MRLSLRLCQTLLLLSLGCTSKPSTDPIVIGLLAPLSGPEQEVGKAMEQGVALAIEEAKDNPVHGRAIHVLMVDTAGNADTTFHQAVRLVAINRVSALIGGPDAASAERLCRVGETYQLPVLTLAWLPPRRLGPFGFSVGANPTDRGTALARYGVAKEQRVAILTQSEDPLGPLATAAFEKELKAEQITYQGLFSIDALAAVQPALATKPDVLLVAGDQGGGRWPENLTILFGGTVDSPRTDTTFWTTAFAARDPASQEFAARFEKKIGQTPTEAAALAYDAARLWIESARKAEQPQPTKIKDELAKWTDFSSAAGPLAIDADHGARRRVFVIKSEAGTQSVAGSLSR